MKKNIVLILLQAVGTFTLSAQIQSGFEFANFDTLKVIDGSDLITKGYYGNADNNGTGKFFYAPILWDTSFGGYWKSGWALSKLIDTTEEPSDYTKHLYAARPGTGAKGVFDQSWAIGQNGSKLYFTDPADGKNLLYDLGFILEGFYYTNTTYAYNSMLLGDFVGKKFGGDTKKDPDFFTLTVLSHGKSLIDQKYNCDTFTYPLADFTFSDTAKDFILSKWAFADFSLESLRIIDSLEFKLSSSDVGDFGMNTPAFFAIDALQISRFESVDNIDKSELLSLYPNPSENVLNLTVAATPVGIQVRDLSGKLIQLPTSDWKVLENKSYTLQMDITELSAGMYVVSIGSDKGIVAQAFTKK